MNLAKAMNDGRFRPDLYYRLAGFPLEIPPLRERLDDIPLIARRFLEQHAHRTGRGPWTLHEETLDALMSERWPGNIRQLINSLERATILQPAGVIDTTHLVLGQWSQDERMSADHLQPSPMLPFREHERRYLAQALRRTSGKIYGKDGAAALLGLKPTTLQSKLKKHGLKT
jgi:transcriptional regulator with GAF, ATPase, and Fis domain